MTPRGTDWTLALLVGLGVATGLASWFVALPGWAWVLAAHGVVGIGLAAVVAVKLRRVAARIAAPSGWDAATARGLLALALVAGVLGTGFVWSSGGDARVAGYNVLNLHNVLGGGLALAVGAHALARARRPRRRDVTDRRQLLQVAGVTVLALGAWQVQRPLSRLLGWRGADRRFTGSYAASSFSGNAFPATSWVADDPREIAGPGYRLAVRGNVARELSLDGADLDAGDELTATLDCTGGFHTTQRWRGVRLGRLVRQAGPLPGATHVRVVSHTGYRASFALAAARDLVLATHVGDEPLSHGHGAPARLVVPGRRGFQWVKWVVAVELADGPDPGALASTVWSSATPEGRGQA